MTLTLGVVGDTIKAKGSGSGIYTKGNWAWISDEEDGGKVDEKILAEARQIAAFAESSAQAPVKMTRRQLQDMKARASGASATTTPDPVQKSSMGSESTQGLAGKAVGSRRASRAAVNYNESTPTEGGDDEPTLSPKQRTPSTLESSMSHGSTPVPGQVTRSTSASTMPHQADPDPEQLTRPKLSWNAIVYEVFVNSTIPEMTLPEIQQGVKDLFPYYALPENGKTLESSPRNPLYNHPSFLKTVRDDGKIAWSLIPGDFLDKKTGKVLNAVPSVKYTETSAKTTEDDVDHTLSTPHLQTPPASNGGAEALESTSNDNHSPMGQALEMSPHENTNDDMEVDHDNGQVGEGLSRAVAANSPQEVPETQLPGSSPQKAVETQHPSSSVQEVIETQQPTLKQPSTGQSLHLSEQWRLENIVRECLMETFEDQDVEWFLQQTKLWYFKNMVLTQSDVAWILNDLFPIRDCISPASYMATCAEELQEHYREQMWASDWFEEFVSNPRQAWCWQRTNIVQIRENVTQFDKMNEGFLKYADLTKPKRHNFWLARSLWNRDTCTRILSPLSDVIDAEKVWTTKHWHDCVEKLYATACDATCELRGQEYVFAMVKEALDERYPDRDSPSWNVPILKSAVKPRKPSIAASASAMGSGSAASPVRHTPIKTVFSPGPPWRGLSSKTTTKVGDAKENVRANSIEYLLNSTTD